MRLPSPRDERPLGEGVRRAARYVCCSPDSRVSPAAPGRAGFRLATRWVKLDGTHRPPHDPEPAIAIERTLQIAILAATSAWAVVSAGCSAETTGAVPDGSDASPRADADPTPDTGFPSDSPTPEGDAADTGPTERDVAEDSGTPPAPPPDAYRLTDEPYTSLQTVWAPLEPSPATLAKIAGPNLDVTDIDKYDRNGLGVERHEGQPWAVHNDLAPGFDRRTRTPERESLLYFWQVADPQLIDEESPIRFEGATVAPIGSTYRPNDHLTTQVFDAQVRTARRISQTSGRPFDFVFLAGDLTDGGQQNELEWGFEILEGSRVHPDSGADDDPVPGPHNDFADPFPAAGLDVPWYMAVGNHETQYLGALPVTDEVERAVVGDEVYDYTGDIPFVGDASGLTNGYRDSTTRLAEVTTSGSLPADDRRRILPLVDVIRSIRTAGGRPAGHGFEPSDVDDEKGYFSFRPSTGKPIRVIVLDTLMQTTAHVRGAIDRRQFEWLRGELQRASSRGEIVIVGAHHPAGDLARLSPVQTDELESLLAGYENVLLFMVGHGHENSMKKVSPGTERGYWELMCASLVDFPMQSRLFEFVYEGDGYLSIYATNMSQNSPPGTLAHRARELAAARPVFLDGSVRGDWEDQHETSNLLLRYELPQPVVREIERESWPTRVESTQTLKRFTEPNAP